MPRHSGCLEASLDAAIALGVPPSDQAVIFHPSVIRNVVHDPNRFAEVSVAIVDYDMPGENGMEICRRLRNHPVRTVMLTGKADEKLATSAFNQGLIDRFVLKHDSATVDRLDDLIAELQLDYFDRMRSELSAIIGLQESAFLGDEAFSQLLDKILKRRRRWNTTSRTRPPGLLMLRADGTSGCCWSSTTTRLPSTRPTKALSMATACRRDCPPGSLTAAGSPGSRHRTACTRRTAAPTGKLTCTPPNESVPGIAA